MRNYLEEEESKGHFREQEQHMRHETVLERVSSLVWPELLIHGL